MRTLAILPVKRFDAAKQRLARVLGAGSRQALAQAMFLDVLASLRHVDAIDDILVVTSDPVAEAAAASHRVAVLRDAGDGQSTAASFGLGHPLARRAHRALLVPGDVPLLDPAELAEWLEVARREPVGLRIVPDRHGEGTNALLHRPPGRLRPGVRGGQPGAPHRPGPRRGARRERGPGAVAPARRGHARGPRRGVERARRAARARSAHARGPAPARPRSCDRLGRDGPRARSRAGGRRAAVVPLVASALALAIRPLGPFPEVRAGDDLGALLAAAAPDDLDGGDVVAVAHKVVSKAEGRTRALDVVVPGERARELRSTWAATRGSCRSCSTSRPRCCAPSPGGSSRARTTASCAPTPASTSRTSRRATSCSCPATLTARRASCGPRLGPAAGCAPP